MRREILSEIRWLTGGAAIIESMAVVNFVAPVPDRGKAIAGFVVGGFMAAGAIFEYAQEKRRERREQKQHQRRSNLL